MTYRRSLWFVVLVLWPGALATAAFAEHKAPNPVTQLMVADFNSGTKPNNIGGDFGCWIKDQSDPMQGCLDSFDGSDRYGSSGYALRIIYSVASKNPAFGGLWMRLQNLDATKFDNLAFRVRGDAGMGYTSIFKVELKDAVDQSSHYYVRGVTDHWQDVTIPLNDFQGMANFKRLKEFVIVFEDTTATAKRGVIYLDDVRFTTNPS
jgi:carbohydrate binding protein with CBM11 domain